MPYAPGIQDISGQLIAQGMSQAGAARARAIESLGESITGGIKSYQQNQLFTNQALAKFGTGLQDPQFKQYVQQIVNDDPNAPQVPEALKKAFKNAAAGEPDIYDSALLGTAADSYQQTKAARILQQLHQAQAANLESEAALRTQQLQNLQRDQQFWANLEARVGRQGQEQPQGQQPTVDQTQGIPVSAASFLTPLPRYGAQQVPSGIAAMLPAAPAAAPSPAGQPGARQLAAPTDADMLMARSQLPPGASIPQIRLQATQIAKDRAAMATPPQGLYLTQTETIEAKSKLPQTPGMMWVDEYVPQAKGWVLKQVPAPETPEIAAQRALDVELGKQQAAEASAMITKSKTQAEAARLDTPRLDRIQKALEQGVKTGFAAEEISGLTSALVELGFYPEGKQATKDVLLADLAQDALQKAQQFYQGQGAVSEAERRRIDKLAMDAKKQPAALLELLKTTRALYERQIAADSHRMALEDQFGDAPRARLSVAKGLDRWYSQNPLSKFGVTQPKAAAGSAQGKLESLLSEFPETK